MHRRVTPNREEAVGKVLDGEAIIINLVTGAYYSTLGPGAVVWQAIEESRTFDDIVSAVTRDYDVSEQIARLDVERLVQEMAAENLVRTEDVASESGEPQPPGASPLSGDRARAVYESPVFHVYRDMSDLLALDPPMPVFGEPPADWESEPKE